MRQTRMSCNECRVLRKGCSEGCTIRPCLQWIKSPDAQANATLFLSKFYGRAGLIDLIDAVPHHLRLAIFRSLLYEACGWMVNPVYGAVGLLWSGTWQLCQATVKAVFRGAPVTQYAADATAAPPGLRTCDIRHVARNPHDLLKVAAKSRARFKCPASATRPPAIPRPDSVESYRASSNETMEERREKGRTSSPDSTTVEALELISDGEADGKAESKAEIADVRLNLTLSLVPAAMAVQLSSSPVELGLSQPA